MRQLERTLAREPLDVDSSRRRVSQYAAPRDGISSPGSSRLLTASPYAASCPFPSS